ncbi:MAG: thiamine phosphate synthase [Rickettsiales bacterium]
MASLYLISPPSVPSNFAALLEGVLQAAPVAMFQWRVKLGSPADFLAESMEVCRRFSVPFIINDDVALAKACGADGAHVGESDGSVADARAALGERAIVGVSCYDDLSRAARAEKEGASYVSFGAFFPTRTKIAKASPPLSLLREWKNVSAVPCCAIGGINAENAASVADAGADMIAVVSHVWNASASPALAAAALARHKESALS